MSSSAEIAAVLSVKGNPPICQGTSFTIFHLQVSPGDTHAGCLQGGDGWDMPRAGLSERQGHHQDRQLGKEGQCQH